VTPDVGGPVHAYLLAAPGCWERYCALEEWKATLVGDSASDLAQDLVDCYAVQHATNTDRRNRQSVAVHLMSLCAGIERGVAGRARRRALGRWVHREYPALEPFPTRFAVTASDLAAAPVAARSALVDRMAATTWDAWADHHAVVRAWMKGA
jgi:Family of unknown function (DUF5946)